MCVQVVWRILGCSRVLRNGSSRSWFRAGIGDGWSQRLLSNCCQCRSSKNVVAMRVLTVNMGVEDWSEAGKVSFGEWQVEGRIFLLIGWLLSWDRWWQVSRLGLAFGVEGLGQFMMLQNEAGLVLLQAKVVRLQKKQVGVYCGWSWCMQCVRFGWGPNAGFMQVLIQACRGLQNDAEWKLEYVEEGRDVVGPVWSRNEYDGEWR